MASLIYNSFWHDLFNGAIVPSSDAFKGLLVTSAYTPSKTAHTKRSDITNEVSATGYTAGGAVVTATVVNATGNSDREQITFSSPQWAGSTITARGLVVYKARGGAASADNVVQYVDFGADVTSTNGVFTANIGALTLQN
jgi:hypothetical protein